MTTQFIHELDFGDRVQIDGGAVKGVVIGFCLYPHGLQIQVSWWNAGAVVEQWFAEWRVRKTSE